MHNLYVEEKLMKLEERERQRKADQAWMWSNKGEGVSLKKTFFFKNRLHLKGFRKIYVNIKCLIFSCD